MGVLHAEQMGYEYLELQQRLTNNDNDNGNHSRRELFQLGDAKERHQGTADTPGLDKEGQRHHGGRPQVRW